MDSVEENVPLTSMNVPVPPVTTLTLTASVSIRTAHSDVIAERDTPELAPQHAQVDKLFILF